MTHATPGAYPAGGAIVITARIEDGELIIEGRAQVGEKYTGICCAGHEWEIAYIFPDETNHGYDSLWGACANPDCLADAPHYLAEDVALMLAERGQ